MPYFWSKNRKLGMLGSVYSEILRGDDGVSQAHSFSATNSPVCARAMPKNHLSNSNFMFANRVSMSLRRSPISWRSSAMSFLVATSEESCTLRTTADIALACGSSKPAFSRSSNICSVSNAGSAITQFSLSKILSQQPLTPSEDEAYIAAQVLETSEAAVKSPRQSAAFISPMGFAQWAGVRLIQDPQGKYARRLVAVFSACPPPAENRGLSLSTRSKAMSASAQGTSVPSLFSFEEKPLRAVVIDGEPWFVAADVCAALEISNPSMALRVLDDDEKALSLIEGLSKLVGGNEQVNIINDSGLYTLT